jgi:hypothetical protein
VRRKFDVVMVWVVDRLGRPLPDLIASGPGYDDGIRPDNVRDVRRVLEV